MDWLIGVVHCFGTVGYACATRFEKCEKEGKAYVLCWKNSRMWAHFLAARNARIWSFLKTTMHFICIGRCCCSLSYSSFFSQRCGCIYALYLLFRFHARLLALPRSHHNFCHFDVTTRQLAPLQCIQYLRVLPYLCLQKHACYTVQCQVLCEPHKFNNGIYPIQYVYEIHAPCRDVK